MPVWSAVTTRSGLPGLILRGLVSPILAPPIWSCRSYLPGLILPLKLIDDNNEHLMTYKWPNVGRDAAQYYTVRPVVVLLVLQPTHLVRSLLSTRTRVHMVDGDASLGHVNGSLTTVAERPLNLEPCYCIQASCIHYSTSSSLAGHSSIPIRPPT